MPKSCPPVGFVSSFFLREAYTGGKASRAACKAILRSLEVSSLAENFRLSNSKSQKGNYIETKHVGLNKVSIIVHGCK